MVLTDTPQNVISSASNPRAALVCEEHGLQLTRARYFVASHLPWDAPGTCVPLGLTDDVELALRVKDALTPVVPGETFSVRTW